MKFPPSYRGGGLSQLGITASAKELNYCKGVTSKIQTQLNGKLDKNNPMFTGILYSNALTTGNKQFANVLPDRIIIGNPSTPLQIEFADNHIINFLDTYLKAERALDKGKLQFITQEWSTLGSGGWTNHQFNFGVTFSHIPLVTIASTTPFSNENIMLQPITNTACAISVYAPSTNFTYGVRMQAVGIIS